jgi:UDPglucose 6-dehydrogenase/UDP-N-acetyl-D-galactosamine dehydrogenase
MVSELFEKIEKKKAVICIVGVGYVGYPLATAFSKHLKVIGYDIDKTRVNYLNENNENKNLEYSNNPKKISQSDIIIICVPTPVTKSKDPDLSYVESSAEIVGKNLQRNTIVVLESTYYPGATEEIVLPILEKESGLICGVDFKIGYSPERINPGDKVHTIENVIKIVSGIDEITLKILTKLYGLITEVYPAPDLRTAEAAKVIENIQRDLNIALINELAIIMNHLNLDIHQVLKAAGTKWNFHRYEPGLVGGHCIPVDPYYLVYKAENEGYHPQVILAGRAINDSMPKYVTELTLNGLIEAEKLVKGSEILLMGLTYKENVSDIRQSPSIQMIYELKKYGIKITGWDPMLHKEEIEKLTINAYEVENSKKFDAIIIAVKHDFFTRLSLKQLKTLMKESPVLVDVKGIFRDHNNDFEDLFYYKL